LTRLAIVTGYLSWVSQDVLDGCGWQLEEMGEDYVNSTQLCKRKRVTLLYAATLAGSISVVQRLVSGFGADPSIADGKGLTPYRLAMLASRPVPEIRGFLEVNGANECESTRLTCRCIIRAKDAKMI
jgi:hypothetical protein